MQQTQRFQTGVWILTALVVLLSLAVWWPATHDLSSYSLFPVFGLLAFGLMWTHYVSGAIRRYLGLPKSVLYRHLQLTGYFVLALILAHPILLEVQLYIDGFGLPPESIKTVYPTVTEQLAIVAGVAALIMFLLFELHRFYRDSSWWQYIEWANVVAMGLILWHGFTLGGELRQPWFQVVWVFYAVTFTGAVVYTEYSKRKDTRGTKTIT